VIVSRNRPKADLTPVLGAAKYSFIMQPGFCFTGGLCASSWRSYDQLSNGDTTDNYAGGQLFTNSGSGWTPAYPGRDANFNILVDVVPEPATWGMTVLGFFGVGAMLRARRKSVGPSQA
jgi:hypothetical protein